uniref:Uncharacterized protein n=1 Tax=Angiostrongylus cantonensis TaxID=6313 RepID=A0A0K0D728_ANGCA
MGEDAQVEASDDDRALSPVLDGTLKHEEWQDRWICSIDGSYAVGKERSRSKQEELAPCSEYGSVQEMAVEHVISKDSLLMLTGMVVDDSQPVARKSRSVLCGNEFSSIIQLPQSLEMPMKQERLSRPRSDQRDQARISRGMSPIQFNADVQGHARLTSRASQVGQVVFDVKAYYLADVSLAVMGLVFS